MIKFWEDLLISKALLSLSLMCAAFLPVQQTYQPNWASLDRRPIPAWVSAAKFGIFITGRLFGTQPTHR